MTLEVYLNDTIIDLGENQSFQTTYNGMIIGNPTKRFSSYTNTLRVKSTKRNMDFFNTFNIHSNSTVPYTQLRIKVVEDGVQIFEGKCFLERVAGEITIAGITDEADIFDQLNEMQCSEIYDRQLWGGVGTNFNYYKPFGHSKLDAATFYTQRNGLNNIFAPYMDWGKQDFVPDTNIENFDFATVQYPWTTESLIGVASTINWTYAAAGTGTMTSAAMAINTVTLAVLNRKVKIYAGFRYVVTFNINLSGNFDTTAIVVGLDSDEIPVELGNLNYTTLGNKVVSVEFTTNKNLIAIGLYITRQTNAGNQVVIIDNAKILDTSFVVIQDPFFLPSYSWVQAIVKAVGRVFTGTLNYASNFTAAQLALINSCVVSSIRDEMKYPQWFLDERNRVQDASGTQVIGLGDNLVRFPTFVRGSYGFWLDLAGNLGDQQYLTNQLIIGDDAASGFYVDVQVDLVINITTITGGGAGSWVELEFSGVGANKFVRSNTFTTVGRKQITLSTRQTIVDAAGVILAPFSFPKGIRIGEGDYLWDVHSRTNGATATYSMTVEYARFSIIPVEFPQDEAVLMPAFIMPDFTVFDFLKDYLIRTCSMIKYNSRTNALDIASVETIINNKANAVDWSNKRNMLVDDITFTLSEYAQSNLFMDDGGDNNEFAKMSVACNNANIPTQKTFFKSQFSAIQDRPTKLREVAKITGFQKDSDFTYKIATEFTGLEVFTTREREMTKVKKAAALMTLRDSTTSDPVVKYGATTAATFKVANYARWKDFKTQFWNSLEVALDKTKLIQREYNLNRVDINDLDLFKLIYDTNAYYLIVNLRYVPGQMTKVQMFKVL